MQVEMTNSHTQAYELSILLCQLRWQRSPNYTNSLKDT